MNLSATEPVDFVNPFIGTGASRVPTQWGAYGETYPGAVAPHGMVQISPETRNSGSQRGYVYGDSTIYWFSFLNHRSGFPGGSTGYFRILPVLSQNLPEALISGVTFKSTDEFAAPGYYQVKLASGIGVEFTVTPHAGLWRLTFPPGEKIRLVFFDLPNVSIENPEHFTGKSRRYFFSCKSREKLTYEKLQDLPVLAFENLTATPREWLLKIGFSMTSETQAEANLNLEMPDWDFERIRQHTRQEWNTNLSQIEIDDHRVDLKTIFYTAWYHSLLLPMRVSDAADATPNYEPFSPWDTFRTLHPLLCLFKPQLQGEMLAALLRNYQKFGQFPHWPMSGNHIIAIFADSYAKGVTNFDIHQAWQISRKLLFEPSNSQRPHTVYAQLGWVPAEWQESVTLTLEYAYNDWAAAEMASRLGFKSDSDLLQQRMFNYRQVFNPTTQLMQARSQSGGWVEWGGFEEGDTWDYSWFVPHNVQDLINLMGGAAAFTAQLEHIFSTGHYLHDNEPPLHSAWLFNYAGAPWKSQYWVRQILNTKYSNTPGGLPGNDDLGTLSSWYVFSALGFYPVCPGRASYVIGSPQFKKVTLHLSNGQDFVINAPAVSEKNSYLQTARLNGKPFTQSWLDHATIVNGGRLEFEMGPAPNHTWGTAASDLPPSMTTAAPHFQLSPLALATTTVKPHQLFTASVAVHNTGALGTIKLALRVDGEPAATQWRLLDRDQSQTVEFNWRLYAPGRHSLTVAGAGVQNVTVGEDPAAPAPAFQLSQFEVTPIVKSRVPVTATVWIQNISGRAGATEIEFKVNEKMCTTSIVTLAPGKRQQVEFTAQLPAGVHRLAVGDLPPKPVKVYAHPLESTVLQLACDRTTADHIPDKSGLENHAQRMGRLISLPGTGVQFVENSYLEIPRTPVLELESAHFTMTIWLYPDAEDTADFFTQGDFNVLKLQHQGKTLAFFAGGWGRGECRAPTPSDWNQKWHHVAGVCDGAELRLFIDGQLVQTTSVHGSYRPVPIPWNIGRNGEKTNGRRLKGGVADVRIYLESLRAAEIQEVMAEGAARRAY